MVILTLKYFKDKHFTSSLTGLDLTVIAHQMDACIKVFYISELCLYVSNYKAI